MLVAPSGSRFRVKVTSERDQYNEPLYRIALLGVRWSRFTKKLWSRDELQEIEMRLEGRWNDSHKADATPSGNT
ncbi:MAG: hypothetical protein WC822_01650 [Candidatus Paceibacterota bacterium]